MDIQIMHISKPEKNYQVIDPDNGGEEKWAKQISENARKGAALGIDCGKMCHDCAFKHPQPPTQAYYDAVDGALKVMLMGGIFHCHTEDHQDAGRPCSGMMYANLYFDQQNDD